MRKFITGNRTPRGNRRATYQSLEDWIATNGLPGYAKDKLKSIFQGVDQYDKWKVLNPAGDGFCGLYAVSLANKFIERPQITDERLLLPTKEALLDHVINGIEKYAETRKNIIDNLAKYSGGEGDETLIEKITNTYTDILVNTGERIAVQMVEKLIIKEMLIENSLNPNITKMLISMLEEMPTWFGNKPINGHSYFDFDIYNPDHFNKVTLTPRKRNELNQLLVQANVDIFFISFLAYYYERNFIVLFYDSHADPDQRLLCNSVTYINYAISEEDHITHDSITFNSRNYSAAVSQTSLLFNNGHYVLFHHLDYNVREKLISKFMARVYDVYNPWEEWGWGTWQDSGPTAPLVMNVNPTELLELGAAIKKRKKRGKKQKQRLTQRQPQRQRQPQKQTQRQRQRQRHRTR